MRRQQSFSVIWLRTLAQPKSIECMPIHKPDLDIASHQWLALEEDNPMITMF